jgi:NTP pyrophosphatase (non-canonical NTP hydrolase)
MTIEELQEQVKELTRRQGWEGGTVEDRAQRFLGEVSELMEEVRLFTEARSNEEQEEIRGRLGSEMYDVVWNLLDLAEKCDIDVEAAFHRKSEINKAREWTG